MFKFTVTGVQQLQRQLTKANQAIYDHSKRQVEASSQRIVARSRQLVPVRTGALRDSIAAITRGSSAYVGVGGRPASYWYFVEYGTRSVAARPFFRPAAEAEKGPFVAGMASIGPEIEREV